MTTLVQPTSEFLTVNGLRVHYLEWGEAGAPPVVCVHGYTSSAQAFNAPARRLYERAGFEIWGTEPEALRHDGQSVAEHHMALHIA